jgi:FixJ family two-component response regulator
LSNRQIAERLSVSVRTVDGHLYRIFPKLGIERRDQLVHLVGTARWGTQVDVTMSRCMVSAIAMCPSKPQAVARAR